MAVAAIGCAPYLSPQLGLMTVERNGQRVEPRVQRVDPPLFVFEDEFVRAAWTIRSPFAGTIGLELTNASATSIRVAWYDATYITTVGVTTPLFTSVPQVDQVPPNARVLASFPAIRDGSDRSLIQGSRDTAAARAHYREHRDARMRVVLPIIVDGVTNEYTFTFGLLDPQR